jgi:hypothetical protein
VKSWHQRAPQFNHTLCNKSTELKTHEKFAHADHLLIDAARNHALRQSIGATARAILFAEAEGSVSKSRHLSTPPFMLLMGQNPPIWPQVAMPGLPAAVEVSVSLVGTGPIAHIQPLIRFPRGLVSERARSLPKGAWTNKKLNGPVVALKLQTSCS